MGHKTITISDEAYEALSRLKRDKESFTDVILRLTRNRIGGNLLDYVRSLEPDEEFSKIMEEVVLERERISLRST
ncbi:MAG: antitoxin VapB family protein [Crenarchaeota archaeon]|nr:antitoxin VapB family protein [Thermoproteota archaeon]MDW8033800.1 antitoxin VapB family protein [Nitrososphaerota archaeon]